MRYIALAAALIAATPASAANIFCVMEQPNGVQLEYEFRRVSQDYMAEVSMRRGGTTIRHDIPPLWKIHANSDGLGYFSVKDPQFWIFINIESFEEKRTVFRADAQLTRGHNARTWRTLAQGGCGFKK